MSFSDKAVDYLERKKAGMFAIVQTVSRNAEGEMKMNASWKDRTSTARRSLHSGVEKGQDESVVMYLAHGVKYGRHLEDGTPPHIIRPKNKKALRWTGPGGKPIFAKRVNHPGTKPYPVVKPTAEKNKTILRDAMLRWWGAKK